MKTLRYIGLLEESYIFEDTKADMIKKLCILLIVIAGVVEDVTAQTNVYHPFPTIYGDWGLYEAMYPSGGCCEELYQFIYYTSGDTIINTLNYKKVNYINEGMQMGPAIPLNQLFTGGTYNFAYRNDSLNKKVYIVPNDSIHETLWYNFNLNIGDTLKGTYSTRTIGTMYILKVDSIDSMLVCGNYHKRYLCNCAGSGGAFSQTYLIEGMGFTSNFINTYLSQICVFEPNIIYSTNAWSKDACPNELGIKSNITTTSIKIYPNPAKDVLHIEDEMVNEKKQVIITDMLGNSIYHSTFTTQHNTINIADLSEGVYNISMSNNEGVVNKRLVIVK